MPLSVKKFVSTVSGDCQQSDKKQMMNEVFGLWTEGSLEDILGQPRQRRRALGGRRTLEAYLLV